MDSFKRGLRSILGPKLYQGLKRRYSKLRQYAMCLKYCPRDPGFQDGSKLFFVTGRSKSGTTWMAKLLSSHKELFCSSYEYIPFHQDRDVQYAVASRQVSAWLQVALEERTRKLFKNGLIMSLICECKTLSARKLGDKSTRQNASLILEAFPKSQVILMLRDFRDCVVSQAFMESKYETWEGYFTGPEMEALDNHFLRDYLTNYESQKDFEMWVKLVSERPDQVMIVRYEEMKAKSEATLKRVFEFLGVNSADSMVARCLQKNTFQKLSGGRKPGEADASHFYRKGIVGDWRNYFSTENVVTFKEIAGDTLIAAGYEQDNQWSV